MTSAIELDKAMQGVAGWRGVHAVDTLEAPLKAGECAVVNLQGIAEPGSHWVACVRLEGRAVYWCPFGAPPDPRVVAWLGGHPLVSTGEYQGLRSEQCGQFCVFFLRHLAEHSDLYRALYVDLVPGGDNERAVKSFWQRIQKQAMGKDINPNPKSGLLYAGKGAPETAYCLKCRSKEPIKGAHATTMKNGRHAVAGTCAKCGGKVSLIVAGHRAEPKGAGLYLL